METPSCHRAWIPASILGLCFIIGLTVVSVTALQINNARYNISVTGSTKFRVTSDTVKWTAVFSKTTPVDKLKEGHDAMMGDKELVMHFLKEQGIQEKEINLLPLAIDPPSSCSNNNTPREYTLRQTIEISSKDISKVTQIENDSHQLIEKGVVFSTQSLEYYYSKLPELRVSLLADALADAHTRAETIAKNSHQKVGKLQSASMGVVQVLAANSTDVSGYGMYDTSTIQKDVMITAKAVFALR